MFDFVNVSASEARRGARLNKPKSTTRIVALWFRGGTAHDLVFAKDLALVARGLSSEEKGDGAFLNAVIAVDAVNKSVLPDELNPDTADFLRISLDGEGSVDLRRNLFRAFGVRQAPFLALVDSRGYVMRFDVSGEVEAEAARVRTTLSQRGSREGGGGGEGVGGGGGGGRGGGRGGLSRAALTRSDFPWLLINADECCALDLAGIDPGIAPRVAQVRSVLAEEA